MLPKTAILTIVMTLLLIGGVSLGIRLYEKQDRFQLKNIPYKNVSYIEVMNRGLTGKPAIYFRTKDSIELIARQLISSNPVSVEYIDWKNNTGGCEIVLHYPDRHLTVITFFNMKPEGGIISSGAYHYHNDTLLRLFRAQFSSAR